MKTRTLKGVVFDLDGTLVDSLKVTFEAFNHGIVAAGAEPPSAEKLSSYFGPGEDKIFEAIVGKTLAPIAYKACRDFLNERLQEVPLHAGVLEMLDELKSRNMPISIFTGRSWNTTEIILNHHNLNERFVSVVANDHAPKPKPSGSGLLLTAKKMQLEPNELLYVGDSAVDIYAAHSAGSLSAGALWDDRANRQQLVNARAHHLLIKPGDLFQLIC